MTKNENIKTLLIIGNGFDIAHGMKTRYTDFLDFIKNDVGISIELPKKILITDELKEIQKIINESISQNRLKYEDIMNYIRNFGNIWIEYFIIIREKKQREIGEDWIDFEKEIEDIIKKVEMLIQGKEIEYSDLKYILGEYFSYSASAMTYRLPDKEEVTKYISTLIWDLKILTLALECYLSSIEEKISHPPIDIIDKLSNVSAVISYNYTNTWQKIYGSKNKVDIYFIHGQLGKHNLVLGIGETLSDGLENTLISCANFKKYFQKIKYRLGNEYLNIINNPLNHYDKNKWYVVIYGHSLDPTDKESLESLINAVYVSKVIIYYYDENAYNQQIANAIQIIGKNKLIEQVHSGYIEFKETEKNLSEVSSNED